MFLKVSLKGGQEQFFFPSNTLIYGISRDGSKNLNIRTCEHMILGQLMMGARQTKNAPLNSRKTPIFFIYDCFGMFMKLQVPWVLGLIALTDSLTDKVPLCALHAIVCHVCQTEY